jgi:hypothetical protein
MGRCRIIPVVAPARMIEMNDKVAVVGNDGVVEDQLADTAPILEGSPHETQDVTRRPFIRHFDVKGELAFWNGIAHVENLRHDFVAEIQVFTFDPGLIGRDEEAHEHRRLRGFVLSFTKLGNLVDLAHGGVLVDDGKNNTRDGQTWPAPGSYIGSITKLGVVDIAGVRARNVFLRKEAGGTKWADVVRIGGRKQLTDECK